MKTICRPLYYKLLISAIIFMFFYCSPNDSQNIPPTCSITSPVSGENVTPLVMIEISADASDSDGSITEVRFYINGELVKTDNSNPYTYRWMISEENFGSFIIKAVAWDNSGDFAKDELEVSKIFEYSIPENLNDGWMTSSLSNEGIDVQAIKEMMDMFQGEDYDYVNSLLMVKNGKLIFEKYFNRKTTNTLHHLQSTTKSITSALIGIAVDKGLIGSVNDPFFDYLPEYASLKNSSNENITIRHLLTMSPGFEWNEVSTAILGSENDNIIGNTINDYVGYVLTKPVLYTPGTVWYYNSGCPMILGRIINNVSGYSTALFAKSYLFDPLEIFSYAWPAMQNGDLSTHGGLYMRSRDLARIGLLFIRNGLWNGERIISEDWINESTEGYMPVYSLVRYGYLWWTDIMHDYDVYYTSGYGGQNMFIIPEIDMIVMSTCDYSDADRAGPQQNEIVDLVRTRILPAVQ